jgi:hypothetical protein
MSNRSRVVNDRSCPTDDSICTTTTAEHAGAFVVGVSDEPDMATAARAWAAGSDAICRCRCRQLVLDLTGVEFLASHGLQVRADTAAGDDAGPDYDGVGGGRGPTYRLPPSGSRSPVTRPVAGTCSGTLAIPQHSMAMERTCHRNPPRAGSEGTRPRVAEEGVDATQ